MNFALVLLVIAEIFTIAVVISSTRSAGKALAYILLIIGLPLIGIIIYFSIGVNFRKRKLYKKKLTITQEKAIELQQKLRQYLKNVIESQAGKMQNFFKLAQNNRFEFMLSANNAAELLINGEQKFPSLLQDLQLARKHIHLEYYIYEVDKIGNEIAEILVKKAKEGVTVRFIYDDFGSLGINKNFVRKLREAGVEIVPFYHIRWLLFANRINFRNHRKIVVIDGKTAYVGGINVSDKYINNGEEKLFWRDTHVRIKGFAALVLQYIFLTDWNFCANQNIPFSTGYFPLNEIDNFENGQMVQVVSSGPDSDYQNIMYAMMQAVMLSQREVLITTPYFMPDTSFIDALKIASLSGVRIKILVPEIADSKLVNTISKSYYEELLEAGIEIYKYQKGFVHAKTMICDEAVSFVGTANLDQRSFDLNFEVHAIIYDEALAKQHAQFFYKDLEDSKKITLEEWRKRSAITIFIEKAARLISPLM